MLNQETMNASPHVSHSLSFYFFMSVAYRELLLGDRYSQVSVEDVFTKKPSDLQEQPTKNIAWSSVHDQKHSISSKIRFSLIMCSVH